MADVIADITTIIRIIRQKITDDSDMIWTTYNSAADLRKELDGYVRQLTDSDISCMEKLYRLFLPTASFQEHSLSNGWAQEYLKLSSQFDKLYDRLSKK